MGKIVAIVIIITLIYFLIVPKFRTKQNKATQLEACDECGTFCEQGELIARKNGKICKECAAKLKE